MLLRGQHTRPKTNCGKMRGKRVRAGACGARQAENGLKDDNSIESAAIK